MAQLLEQDSIVQQIWDATKGRKSIVYGYSTTAAGTATKEIVLQGVENWFLKDSKPIKGAIIAVKFQNTNAATSNVKFTVKWTDKDNTTKSTTAIAVKYNGANINSSTKEFAGTTLMQMYYYDGTSWNWLFRDYGAPEEVQVPDEVVGGYYKQSDSKFYKESAYTTLIVPQDDVLYIDLSTKKLYVKDDSGQDLVKQASGNNVVDGYENGGYFYLTRSGSAGSYTYSDQVTLEANTLYVDKATLQIFRATGQNLERMTYFTGVQYNSTDQTIDFYNGPYNSSTPAVNRVARLSAAPFVKDGMVDNVEIVNGNLHITFNTDSGKQAIDIPITDIFDASNYYDKDTADATFVAKESGKGLSSNDYTTAEKNKLAGIAVGAQVNTIETIKTAENVTLTPVSKVVTLPDSATVIYTGYLKAADGVFYKTKNGSTYSDEYAGEPNHLYLDKETSKLYSYNGSAWVPVNDGTGLVDVQYDEYTSSHTTGTNWLQKKTSSGGQWTNVLNMNKFSLTQAQLDAILADNN